MHWFPGCPGAEGVDGYPEGQEYATTACRDCLPRQLYPHNKDGKIDGGMCTMTREAVLR